MTDYLFGDFCTLNITGNNNLPIFYVSLQATSKKNTSCTIYFL